MFLAIAIVSLAASSFGQECGVHEVNATRSMACQTTCNTFKLDLPCDSTNVTQCFCKSGFTWESNTNKTCISIKDCHERLCKLNDTNSEYISCIGCAWYKPWTCISCDEGCECVNGFTKNSATGKCTNNATTSSTTTNSSNSIIATTLNPKLISTTVRTATDRSHGNATDKTTVLENTANNKSIESTTDHKLGSENATTLGTTNSTTKNNATLLDGKETIVIDENGANLTHPESTDEKINFRSTDKSSTTAPPLEGTTNYDIDKPSSDDADDDMASEKRS